MNSRCAIHSFLVCVLYYWISLLTKTIVIISVLMGPPPSDLQVLFLPFSVVPSLDHLISCASLPTSPLLQIQSAPRPRLAFIGFQWSDFHSINFQTAHRFIWSTSMFSDQSNARLYDESLLWSQCLCTAKWTFLRCIFIQRNFCLVQICLNCPHCFHLPSFQRGIVWSSVIYLHTFICDVEPHPSET